MTRQNFVVLLFFSVLLTAASQLQAQQPQQPVRRLPTRYVPPAGPPLSPYLQLFRRDSGVIDNYNFFVRPRQDLTYRLNQQDNTVRTLNDQLQRTEQALQRTTDQLQQRTRIARPTGSGAVFMNYSHFFNFNRR